MSRYLLVEFLRFSKQTKLRVDDLSDAKFSNAEDFFRLVGENDF